MISQNMKHTVTQLDNKLTGAVLGTKSYNKLILQVCCGFKFDFKNTIS